MALFMMTLFLIFLTLTGRFEARKKSKTFLVEVVSKETSNESDKGEGDYALNVPICRKQDVDRHGPNIKSVIVANVDSCARECDLLSSCKAWTFRTSDAQCWLKYGVPPESPYKGLWSGVKDCENTESATKNSETAPETAAETFVTATETVAATSETVTVTDETIETAKNTEIAENLNTADNLDTEENTDTAENTDIADNNVTAENLDTEENTDTAENTDIEDNTVTAENLDTEEKTDTAENPEIADNTATAENTETVKSTETVTKTAIEATIVGKFRRRPYGSSNPKFNHGGLGGRECQDRQITGMGRKGSLSALGEGYTGQLSETATGRTCKPWTLTRMPSVGNHNYCRNPSRYAGGVWCYTRDPSKRWELCTVPRCKEDSRVVPAVCSDPPSEKGNCRQRLTMWTYRGLYGCMKFTYGGCGGSANNFESEKKCEKTCGGGSGKIPASWLRPMDENSSDRGPVPAACSDTPSERGNCRQRLTMWTYRELYGCMQFTYGGCGGSENNFKSKKKCEKTCGGGGGQKPQSWLRTLDENASTKG